ncbi:MAG: NAD-dependent epimerase/dehydratase family protein [Candidatus Helarchaeota archaeon]
MKIAITGICSNLGQILVPKLLELSEIDRIIGIDIKNIGIQSQKIDYYRLDIRNYDKLLEVLKNIDILIHLAFIVISKDLPPLNEIFDININGTVKVIKAAINNGVKKIIHLSSQSAYGHLPMMPKIASENSPLLGIKNKNFYYAYSKAVIERFLDNIESQSNIIITRFRSPVIVGKHFFKDKDSAKLLLKLKIIPDIKKDPWIQLIHEEDLVDAIILAIKNDYHGAFNVASNIVNIDEFFEKNKMIKRILIPGCIINFLISLGNLCKPISRYTGWLLASKYNCKLNVKKIKEIFGWAPKYSTEDCLIDLLSK